MVRARALSLSLVLSLSLSPPLLALPLRAWKLTRDENLQAVLPTVDLSGNGGAGDFGKWVAASPRSNLVFEVFGKLRIASAGDYRLW